MPVGQKLCRAEARLLQLAAEPTNTHTTCGKIRGTRQRLNRDHFTHALQGRARLLQGERQGRIAASQRDTHSPAGDGWGRSPPIGTEGLQALSPTEGAVNIP